MTRDLQPVSIRPYSDVDLDLLLALHGSETMMAFLGGPRPFDEIRERHARYISSDGSTEGLYTVMVGDSSAGVGWVGFWESEWRGEACWECGWHVLPRYQRGGIGRTATLLMLEDARARHAHRYMDAFPHVDNVASNALCASLGFADLGVEDVEYPKGSMMPARHWRLDLT